MVGKGQSWHLLIRFWLHLLIAQRVQKTMPTNIPMGKAAEAKMMSLALAKPDFLPVKLAMKAIRKKPHWKERCEQRDEPALNHLSTKKSEMAPQCYIHLRFSFELLR